MHTFQNMVLRLTNFWAEKGCLFHQPYDLETGAATFNPITFLKVLGPEPYKAAYVEPCRRPQDGRYGQNPNRLQLFHQFQVILKPSPENVLQLYLESLAAIGFDLTKHDIRFVHDDWESPTLGAWGLGWEVWMDGMEVTQFTYFQSVAGFPLKPVTAEIAYGLERLSMLLQNKTSFFDMMYDNNLTYKDVIMQNEIEWSTYNFEKADAKMWLEHFNHYEKEAKRLVECNLPIPAYDFVVKASHAFNMLEARGVISVTERTGYILRIRDLAKVAATGYIESRERLGFPLCNVYPKTETSQPVIQSEHKKLGDKENFLFEIGCEMLPAEYVNIGERLLKKAIEELLKTCRIHFSRIETFATPQRLGVLVHDLATLSQPLTIEKKGPLVHLAFEKDGHLTPLGAGFMKSLNVSSPITLDEVQQGKIEGLSIISVQNNHYLFIKTHESGKSTVEILSENLPKILASMIFPKNMRWDSYDETFARPIRWLVALLGNLVIPMKFAGVVAGNQTRGHAQYAPNFFMISNPLDYDALLKEHYVIGRYEERKQNIISQLEKIEKNSEAIALKKERVLNEVVNLVEWPKLVVHRFDHHFLEAPKELLVSEMVEHQRYFPLEDQQGKLKPLFVMTLDHEVSDLVLDNNKKVLSARLSDGVFLYHQDLKHPLEVYLEKLKTVQFQKDLGTVYDKVERLIKEANLLHHVLKIGNKEKVHRAAILAKADLATQLVKEFPELQGITGKIYAKIQNEPQEVSDAIYEHWLPNSENGPIPLSETGILLGLADKFDNIIGYFSVGIRPTSSSDPYALRRQTLGILKILTHHHLKLSLSLIMNDIFKYFSAHSGQQIIVEIVEFFKNRMKTLLEDLGHKKDNIEAILSSGFDNPYEDLKRLKAFENMRLAKEFNSLVEVHKRLKGQVEKSDPHDFAIHLAKLPQEKALYEAIYALEEIIQKNQKDIDFEEIFHQMARLQLPLKEMFDHVKILADEDDLRRNRLGLLQKAYAIIMRFADLSKIQIS